MSKHMVYLCRLLHHLRTSVYPQTDELVERYNQTLKQMVQKVITEGGWDWDILLPYILFATRETP